MVVLRVLSLGAALSKPILSCLVVVTLAFYVKQSCLDAATSEIGGYLCDVTTVLATRKRQ